ncbi:MAG TPA: hypothetical protein VF743_05890 [Acidimicrobiales bacterium]
MSMPLVLLIWIIIGVIVAAHEGFADFDSAEHIVQFVLNVLFWPIPAFGGGIDVRL